MKTLIIEYLPRGERSNTKKILDAFLEKATGEIEKLDLLTDAPDLFLSDNLSAYYRRNYAGEELNEVDSQKLEKMDRMTEQFLNADQIVLVYPMFNFSLPAMVKAYFDSVLQRSKTWSIDGGVYVGLMKGKKALIITSSAGEYTEDFEHSVSLSKALFKFVGIEPEVINAQGLAYPDAEEKINQAKIKAVEIAKTWY